MKTCVLFSNTSLLCSNCSKESRWKIITTGPTSTDFFAISVPEIATHPWAIASATKAAAEGPKAATIIAGQNTGNNRNYWNFIALMMPTEMDVLGDGEENREANDDLDDHTDSTRQRYSGPESSPDDRDQLNETQSHNLTAQAALSEYDDEESVYAHHLINLQYEPLPDSLKKLPESLRVYIQHDFPPSNAQLQRGAPKQAMDTKAAYSEHTGSVNIWHGYNLDNVDVREKRKTMRAPGTCKPLIHAGVTSAQDSAAFCLYFAMGICNRGENCNYFHRVPTLYENDRCDKTKDVFGRDRYPSLRDDKAGVGSYNTDSRTIRVLDFCSDSESELKKLLLMKMAVWGPIERITVDANRNVALITFCYRSAAEFAMVAMHGQRLHEDINSEVITVRWGVDPLASRELYERALIRRISNHTKRFKKSYPEPQNITKEEENFKEFISHSNISETDDRGIVSDEPTNEQAVDLESQAMNGRSIEREIANRLGSENELAIDDPDFISGFTENGSSIHVEPGTSVLSDDGSRLAQVFAPSQDTPSEAANNRMRHMAEQSLSVESGYLPDDDEPASHEMNSASISDASDALRTRAAHEPLVIQRVQDEEIHRITSSIGNLPIAAVDNANEYVIEDTQDPVVQPPLVVHSDDGEIRATNYSDQHTQEESNGDTAPNSQVDSEVRAQAQILLI